MFEHLFMYLSAIGRATVFDLSKQRMELSINVRGKVVGEELSLTCQV